MKKKYFAIVAFLIAAIGISQETITGTVLDKDLNDPLPGANIMVKGTTKGVMTNFDGKYSIVIDDPNAVLVISYIGYVTQEIPASTANSGIVLLETSSVGLEEVLVIANVAVDRKTPVAVSTIKSEEIALKLSTQEFPEVLKATPGVYATKSGGGYGDGRINLRGFASENIAVMINGVPVNDMENGAVYWSNWAGLGDVTSSMQVQRGLGASKVAVPSIGGTINIVTKSSEAIEGGNVYSGISNDGYLKYGMTYSTGLSEKGFAATVSASKISGDGYVDGTEFSGYNYFASLSQQINDDHRLSFTAFGAQQEHGQRFNRRTIAEYRATESGPKKFNPDWGYKNGEVYHQSYNFYHKPQMAINHFWEVSENTVLSTAVYASFGNGGGRRDAGSKIGDNAYRLGDSDQPIDFDKIVEENMANGANGATDIISASFNTHKWYGVLSSFKNHYSDKLVLSGGLDARYYVGSHWYEITDLLGADFYIDTNSADVTFNQALKVGDRYNKDFDGTVLRGGVFAQAEYEVNEDINVFLAGDISQTAYSKVDYMRYEADDPNRESDTASFTGFGIKGGANYNWDANNNVFANIGYFSKAPFMDGAVFESDYTTAINDKATNEKVFSAELGYGYRSSDLSANINLYRTSWLDKAITGGIPGTDNNRYYYNILGMNALHQGVELDFVYNFTDRLRFTGMLSIGDWQWKSNVATDVLDEEGTVVQSVEVFAKDLKVGNSAQTTFALGANYKLADNSRIYVDYNFAGDMYADYDVTNRGSSDLPDTWKVPSYGLFDLGVFHGFDLGPFDASLNGKINNVFNTEYVSDANDIDGTASTALVYYGFGRTYSVSLKVNF